MYTHEWMMASITQAICSLAGLIVAVGVLRIRFATAFLAILLCNSITLGTLPGFGTPFITHDLIFPIIVIMALFGKPGPAGSICWLIMIATFLWPAVGTGIAMLEGTESMVWVTFLFRRLAVSVYFIAAAGIATHKISARDLMETCVVVWIGMAIAGTVQYLGIINIDPLMKDNTGFESITESISAQRGFLGLNRAAVGVWGSAIFGYSLTHLVLNGKLDMARAVLHSASLFATVIVVLFSGSRTGAVALAVAAGFVAIRSIPLLRHTRPARILLFGALGFIVAQPILIKGAFTVSKRLETFQDLDRLGSFQERIEAQRNTIRYVFSDPKAALFGMGPELVKFQYLIETSLSWPHSEYVFTMWIGGIPGLLLYLVMLFAMFVNLRQPPNGVFNVEAVAGQTVLMGGAVMGLTDGCIMIAGSRLAPFGILMFFYFGLLLRECIRERTAAETYPALGSNAALMY